MQIKHAVLLAILSASTASAVNVVLYRGNNCNGTIAGEHNVYDHSCKHDVPGGVQSVFASQNWNYDPIHVSRGDKCQGNGKPDINGAFDVYL
ncbi:hypothetical protein BD779DRAFT_1567174 [Infundibulicybe gibba]|nr:hypothetical protein BD779DRAFT_1567174 [Infundibulicybe gibba]